MKKTSVSLLVLLALLVSGCTSTSKKKKASKEADISSQNSENPTSKQSPSSEVATLSSNPTSQQSPSSQTTTQNPSSSQIEPPPSGDFTVTICTSGYDFSETSGFTTFGIEILTNSDPEKNHLDKLKTYFQNTCGYEGAISNLACTYMFIQPLQLEDYDHMCLTIGAASDAKGSGTMTWISTLDIKKVEVKARAYFKYYSYQSGDELVEGWNHDDYANFVIGGQTTVLPIAEQRTEQQTIVYEPASPVKSFTIGNGEQITSRIFVEELKITFSN